VGVQQGLRPGPVKVLRSRHRCRQKDALGEKEGMVQKNSRSQNHRRLPKGGGEGTLLKDEKNKNHECRGEGDVKIRKRRNGRGVPGKKTNKIYIKEQ